MILRFKTFSSDGKHTSCVIENKLRRLPQELEVLAIDEEYYYGTNAKDWCEEWIIPIRFIIPKICDIDVTDGVGYDSLPHTEDGILAFYPWRKGWGGIKREPYTA